MTEPLVLTDDPRPRAISSTSPTTRRSATRPCAELRALGLHPRSAQEYMSKLRSLGVKGAVEDRDAPFGDGRGANTGEESS